MHDAAGAARLAPAHPAPVAPAAIVRALVGLLSDAAKVSVTSALASLGDWTHDQDLCDLAEDLTETLAWGPATTHVKGSGALRRLEEYLDVLPSALARAVATQDVIDVVLSSFVCARLRVFTARKGPGPAEWTTRPIPAPTSVKGEVGAIVGMLRLAALLPPDPRNSLMRTRRIMRKTGCLQRHAASPRGYTFLWELVTAWEAGIVPRSNPQAVAAFSLFVTGVHFLLRPRYVRSVSGEEIRHIPPGPKYQLEWVHADKTRPELLGPASAAAAAGPAGPMAGRGRAGPPTAEGLPARHPRVSAAQGDLLHLTQSLWRPFRGDHEGPLFCRVELARQTERIPPGARLVGWEHNGTTTPAFLWPRSQMSERILKKWLVEFLTPIVGAKRAQKRVPSGLRGGGEMEFVELLTPVSVRATVGWWVAKRVSAEGALVTYEGCSLEAMWAWGALLGTLRLQVLAPGVFRHLPLTPSRSIRRRMADRSRSRAAILAARSAAEAATASVPQHAAPHAAAARLASTQPPHV